MNIILIGMMGSGKSTIGEELSKKLKMELIDTDFLIEKNNSMNINDIFENYGEEHFRLLEKATFKDLSKCNNTIISTGGGAVLNDTLKPFERQEIIYLKWSVEGLLSNLTNKVESRPLLDNDCLKEKISSIYKSRKNMYEGWAQSIIECDGKSVDEVVGLILQLHK